MHDGGAARVTGRGGDGHDGGGERDPEPGEPVGPGGRAHGGDAEMDRLATAARTGEARAVEDFLRAIQTPVLRYCRAKMATHGTLTPQDVAQDVLYAVCDALPRYTPTSGTSVMAFVLGIARYKIVDSYRSGGRDRSVPVEQFPEDPTDVADGPEFAAVRSTETARLRAALATLSEHHREVIVYRVALGYSAEEVATLLGTTAGAVRVTQHRAMAKLRGLLTGAPDD